MSKSVRQSKILEIITSMEVDTQEELASILNGYDFNVTQATVSRDIKELGLIKIAGKTKKYRYAIESENGSINNEKMLNLFKNCVISIERVNNIIIVKTLGGNGNSAGVIIDRFRFVEVLGCVAGDDTVLIVAKGDNEAQFVVDKLKEIL
ncbi:MAG: arginine repressor [Clostridia bacterium]|jgi:transcriptional regulator of arginine metabolism|nr:arginine repressor [Clostridia bacterium]MBR1677612.1 arginine repressor [Clostridia bacterium]